MWDSDDGVTVTERQSPKSGQNERGGFVSDIKLSQFAARFASVFGLIPVKRKPAGKPMHLAGRRQRAARCMMRP
jgi:hypothetical protein